MNSLLLMRGCIIAAIGTVLLAGSHAQAQTPGGAQLPPAPPDEVGGTEEAEQVSPRVDFDGTEQHAWWVVSPSLALRLHHEAGRDELLPDWPVNLVEGPRTSAGVFEFSRSFGRLTLWAGAGLGVTTTRSGGPANGAPVERDQQVSGVVTTGLKLRLPQSWTLHFGASTYTSATGSAVRAGVTAEKTF